MRHTAHLCTKMAYQTEVTKNTFCLRVALVQHVFTRVVPLPLPPRHPQRDTHCFWAAAHRERTLRYETQVDLMRLLNAVAQHFAAAALSLRATRAFDATRVSFAAKTIGIFFV